MNTEHLAWLLPAWLIGAPLLLGLWEFATLRSRRERVDRTTTVHTQPDTVRTDRLAGRAY